MQFVFKQLAIMLIELLLVFGAFVAQPEHGPQEFGDNPQQVLENPDLYDGDILVPNGEVLRGAIADEKYRWPNATVPYVIDKRLASKKKLIEDAMKHIQDNTCVKFVERKDETEYIRIYKGSGCHTGIGRNTSYSQPQPFSLGEGCYYSGIIIHELGHVLGLIHEHNRSDRDKYLKIYLENVRHGHQRNFHKLEPSDNILINDFDYDSIMIYGNYAFSKQPNVKKTMEAINGHVLKNPGQKTEMTKSDIERVKKLYKCS